MTTKQTVTTSAAPFFRCNPSGQLLFAVQPGIPSGDALSWASCLLDTVVGLLAEVDDENPSAQNEAARCLAEMAKAVVDAVGVAS